MQTEPRKSAAKARLGGNKINSGVKAVPVAEPISLPESPKGADSTWRHLQIACLGAAALVTTLAWADLPPSAPRMRELCRELPLSFEPNVGQSDPAVRFLSRSPGFSIFLTDDEAVLKFKIADETGASAMLSNRHSSAGETQAHRTADLRMRLIGTRAHPQAAGINRLPGTINYFIGNDPAKWRRNIPTFARVEVTSVYPGVDLVYYGNQRQLEYDFIVAPDSDPNQIRLNLDGANEVSIDANGDLMVRLEGREVRFRKPVIYQPGKRNREEISGGYQINEAPRHAETDASQPRRWQVSFALGKYDRSLPLVIDPIVWNSSYLGGSGFDFIRDLAVDSQGQAYLTGETFSPDFLGSFDATGGFAFVAKISNTGSSSTQPHLLQLTMLGGSGGATHSGGVAVGSNSPDIFVTGSTKAADFPVTAGAFEPTHNWKNTVFVARIGGDGNLVYSSFLGASGDDRGFDIAVEPGATPRNAYITGATSSPAFPQKASSPTAIVGSDLSENVFIARVDTLAAGADSLIYSMVGPSSFVNEAGVGIAVNNAGEVYVLGRTESSTFPLLKALMTDRPGRDAFLMKLASGNSAQVLYSTYFGGNGDDDPVALAVRGTQVFITGSTKSTDLPVLSLGPFGQTSAFQSDQFGTDAFVAKIDEGGPHGSPRIVYSTYLGGSSEDFANGIAVDLNGNVYISGNTQSANFPTKNPLSDVGGAALRGPIDAFVAELSPFGTTMLFGTYLGGSGIDRGGAIALDPNANIYVVGQAGSTDFPVRNLLGGASHGDLFEGFFVKIGPPDSGAGVTGAWGDLAQVCHGRGHKSVCVLAGEFEVRNVGIETAGNFAVAFYLSEDETVDENDLFLSQVHVGHLESHASTSRDLHVALPPGVNATGLRVIALVDVNNDVDEPNENNNVIVSAPIE